MQVQSIALAALKANDWNANVMEKADLTAMAERFKALGTVDKPLTVRPVPGSTNFQILDGEQTARAAKAAGLKVLPCIVVEVDDVTAIATTYVKNLHGRMSPLLVGRMILRMREIAKAEGRDLPNTEAARMLNKSEGTVRNYLLYVDAAERCGKVPGWPTEAAISAMTGDEVRDLLAKGVEQPIPLEGGSAAPAEASAEAEETAKAEKAKKAFNALLAKLPALTIDELTAVKNAALRLIRERKEEAEKTKETAAE